MVLYVLTCINEELEIISQDVFTNFIEACHKMKDDYERERQAMIDNNNEDYIVQDGIFATSATLVYGDQPYQYEWKILKIDA